MKLPRLVGITGPAGSGKDTLAAALIDTFGYTRRALADPIKELLNHRFGWTAEKWDDREWKEAPSVATGRLLDEGRRFYLDKYLSPRQLAQWLGTEVGRDTFGPNVWIDKLIRDWTTADEPLTVVPDVRFDNEADAIRRNGGVIVRVKRLGVKPVSAHVSEAGVSDHLVDLTVVNDRDIHSFIKSSLSLFRIYLT